VAERGGLPRRYVVLIVLTVALDIFSIIFVLTYIIYRDVSRLQEMQSNCTYAVRVGTVEHAWSELASLAVPLAILLVAMIVSIIVAKTVFNYMEKHGR